MSCTPYAYHHTHWASNLCFNILHIQTPLSTFSQLNKLSIFSSLLPFASLGAIIVFGENIRRYMNTNLVLLIVIVQLAYLGILIYLDWYFESRQQLDTWIRVQNS
ncbi:MAG: DUF6040 family protein [Lachnospiraceae bacterium]|nr:DUF6040 family protein [Lachnospiraceae bacterium]